MRFFDYTEEVRNILQSQLQLDSRIYRIELIVKHHGRFNAPIDYCNQ